jgi:DNA-binding CsgD family transcriptional regulator
MKSKAPSRTDTKLILERIHSSSDAHDAFDAISTLSKALGFNRCLVLEAVISIVPNRHPNSRVLNELSLVFSDMHPSAHEEMSDIFRSTQPSLRKGGKEFYGPQLEPFATGLRWYNDNEIKLTRAEHDYYRKMDKLFGTAGTICFPVRSAQSESYAAAAVVMTGEVSSDWLTMFLSDVAPSVQPVIQVYQDVLYPHLIQLETMRVGLNQRELDCLNMIANGYNTKGVAHKFDVTNAMVSRYLRNAQEKLRVPNLATAVLKAQRLNLVAF